MNFNLGPFLKLKNIMGMVKDPGIQNARMVELRGVVMVVAKKRPSTRTFF